MVLGVKVPCGNDDVGIDVVSVFMYSSVCFHFVLLRSDLIRSCDPSENCGCRSHCGGCQINF